MLIVKVVNLIDMLKILNFAFGLSLYSDNSLFLQIRNCKIGYYALQ